MVLSVYSEYAPQYLIIFDMLTQVLIGSIAIPLDKELSYQPDDPLNIKQWYMWGLGLNVFATVLIVRFYYRRNWDGFKLPLRRALKRVETNDPVYAYLLTSDALDAVEQSEVLIEEIECRSVNSHEVSGGSSAYVSPSVLRNIADLNVLFITFFAFCFIIFISYLLEVYSW